MFLVELFCESFCTIIVPIPCQSVPISMLSSRSESNASVLTRSSLGLFWDSNTQFALVPIATKLTRCQMKFQTMVQIL